MTEMNSSHTYNGQARAKPVPPHASVLLVQTPNATRANLTETKIITEKLSRYNQFAYLVLKVEPIPEAQLIFTNHVEQTRLLPEYTSFILEAVFEHTLGFTGLHIVLLDGIDHPIDSRESIFKILTQRALQKAFAATEAIP
jgi:hypothetical protein